MEGLYCSVRWGHIFPYRFCIRLYFPVDCNCIVMKGEVYDEILPEPERFPEGSGNISLYTRLKSQYSHSQLPLLTNIFSY